MRSLNTRRFLNRCIASSITIAASIVIHAATVHAAPPADWPAYGRDLAGTRYSPLTDITPGNVATLEPAWTFDLGEIEAGEDESGWVFECTPLVVDGRMYVITPKQRILCINAASGDQVWAFEPEGDWRRMRPLASRGVAYWTDGDEERIIAPIRDGRIFAVDANTGKAVKAFGVNGAVHLRDMFAPDNPSRLFLSSPPAILGDTIITHCGQPDGSDEMVNVPVVALDVRTGLVKWTFNTIPEPGEFGADTWSGDAWENRGGANAWSILSVDPELGLVYLPTGSANLDFFGGDRPGRNLFANCVLALDAETGERRWHYQTLHHDLWDYDLPAQPILCDLTIDGERVPAVAQIGKTGFLYVLRRDTGEPVWPIEERPVPESDVPGEIAYETQPFPTKPPAFSKQGLTKDDLTTINKEAHEYALETFAQYRADGLFTPPSLQGSIIMPGYHGGGNWSGGAFDKEAGRFYINTTEMVCLNQLKPYDHDRLKFKHTGWVRLRDEEGYPLNAPPWGKLVCYDLNKGVIEWEVPLGEFGQENFGGPTVTAASLVFIASTMDEKIRAFDAGTGKVLWSAKLPAAGYAAPVTYAVNGTQYVAITCGGGGKLATPTNDKIMAFALSKN